MELISYRFDEASQFDSLDRKIARLNDRRQVVSGSDLERHDSVIELTQRKEHRKRLRGRPRLKESVLDKINDAESRTSSKRKRAAKKHLAINETQTTVIKAPVLMEAIMYRADEAESLTPCRQKKIVKTHLTWTQTIIERSTQSTARSPNTFVKRI